MINVFKIFSLPKIRGRAPGCAPLDPRLSFLVEFRPCVVTHVKYRLLTLLYDGNVCVQSRWVTFSLQS